MTIHHDTGTCNWENIPVLAYKEEGTHFKSITRRTLFEGTDSLPGELRYFEIASGGHSTLERHEHVHVVMILRGAGHALIGNEVQALTPFDYVTIRPRTWHQFRATGDGPLGFLCLVNRDRDRPERPDADALAGLRLDPVIAAFIKT